MVDDPSKAGPNSPRDRFGVDMNRFVWAGATPIQAGPKGDVSFINTTLTGSYNDYNPTTNQVSFGESTIILVTTGTSADVTITGMVAALGGEIKTFVNRGAGFINILHQSASSISQNRFYCGSDIIIAPGNSASFWYDPINFCWQLSSLRGGVLSALPMLMSGGSAPLGTGVAGWLEIPAACTLTGWKLMSTELATMSMDVWKVPFASFPPTVANSICGGNLPTLTAAKSNSDTVLTGWTTAFSRGDIVMFNVSSTNGAAIRAMISLDVIRTQ